MLRAAPNPERGNSVIELELHAPSRISLDVFDLRGARVRRLMDGVRTAGTHRVSWDGADEAGRPVSSGVYVVRLAAEQQALTTRITLLR